MARPRQYTPAKLRKAVNSYFLSITRTVQATELVDNGKRDERGHTIFERVTILNDLGTPVEITEYIVPPSVTDLCKYLKIHRSTWANYKEDPEYREITEDVFERMKAWNERELLTRPGKDTKGIMFNLQQNYGWGGEKHEMELGAGALEALLEEMAK